MAQTFNQDKFTALKDQSTLYSDFFDNFVVHPELHDLVLKTNQNSVLQSIHNIIRTQKYERPFSPKFGCNINKYLFEPINNVTTQAIKDEIVNAIGNYEPRAKLISVVVTPYIDQNAYTVTVTFYIINTSTPVTLNTILYRVR
jgi:phage baseplate assembly protein W